MSDEAGQAEEDRALVKSALERRAGAFERLIERHQRLVWHMVHRVVRHPEDTRDVCQETFLRVHRELHRFRFESRLSTWIARIAWHAALRHLERKQIPLADSGAGDSVIEQEVAWNFDLEQSCETAQLHERVRAIIDSLPPLKRAVLTLHYLEDLGISDIAAIVGRPEGTVKSELLRARNRIRQLLGTAPGEST